MEIWRTSGAERVGRALRRNMWMILVVVVFTTAAAILIGQAKKPVYTADSKVLILQQDLGATLTGGGQTTDPQRVQATELELANSGRLFELTAAAANGTLGTPADLAGNVHAEGSDQSDIISFVATAPAQALAMLQVNAVAKKFVGWRAELSAEPIKLAIAQARKGLEQRPDDADLRKNLTTLLALETLNSGQAVVVEEASSASEIRPSLVRNALVGFSIGLVLSLLTIGLREFLDNRVREVEDAESILGAVPVWGMIPPLARRAGIASFGSDLRVTDAYALLLAAVSGFCEETKGRIVAVTSATAGEGKSTTVVNLGVTAAKAGLRVLIVDADVRRRGLTAALRLPDQEDRDAPAVGIASRNGATSPRTARIDLEHSSSSRVVLHEDGTRRDAPSEGGSLTFLQMLTESRAVVDREAAFLRTTFEQFDLVLIDCPPSLETPTALDVSRFSDGVLILVRSGVTRILRLRRLLRQTESWRTPVVGAVLADVSTSGGYGYYAASGARPLAAPRG